MPYIHCKNVGRTQENHSKKPTAVKSITEDQWQAILQAIEDDSTNKHQSRDYALIFIGASLGLRRGEACVLERKHFRDLDKYDVIYMPTLKQSEKIVVTCKNSACGKNVRVKLSSAGKTHKCPYCGLKNDIPKIKSEKETEEYVEMPIDIVEPQTVGFIFDYLDNYMRPDQQFLFEGRRRNHISISHANNIFNTYAAAAGLDPNISFHSLRHNRGVRVYSKFKDLVLCKDLLRHKNIATTQIYAALDQESKDRYRAELAKTAFDPLKKRKKKSQ